MLIGRDIICVSSIDWDFIWQGHQEIMSTLAANGNRVLFIENTGVRRPNLRDLPRLKKRMYNWFHSVKGIREGGKNLYIYSPVILPFPYSRIARWLNRYLLISALQRWIKSAGFTNPIVWTFLPTGIVLDVIDALDPKLVIYYCIDNFSASSKYAKGIHETEQKLLKKSDLVFVTAKNLHDWCSRHNGNVHMFPFGVNLDIYERGRNLVAPVPADMESIPHPIAGYVGGVHKWIDFELVRYLAKENPGMSFVFVGPLQTQVDDLKVLPNVYFLGQKRYEELPGYVKYFDTCLIPYVIAEYTKNVYPTKSNEYLAMGKSVVSTAIPEIVAYNQRNDGIISIAYSQEEFSALAKKTVAQKHDDEICEKRVAVAANEGSWKEKIEKMGVLIERQLADKERQRSAHWKDNLLRVYKGSRKRLAVIAGITIVAYLVLFHTPLVWVVGKPLRVSSEISKADVIIVLAGGVGESGRPGQGYEERVQYGVKLYKQKYAPYLIFSSGFKYAFKEAEVMKALAVSLGVPASAIILEAGAANTYENVVFTNKVLSEHHWSSAIIVSSPYNMLRVSLVCRKNAPGIHFVYAPLPNSMFFKGEKKIELKHIVAILHEYVGIMYYALKGYV